MANACFRCKTSIESGRTFCGGCRGEVSLEFPYTRDTRLWLLIAGLPVAVAVVAAADALLLGGTGLGVLGAYPLSLAFAFALYRDCEHVRRRDDRATDWTPSKWGYSALAFASMLLIVPMVVVAPYHLYRRKQSIGLVLRGE